MAYSFVAMERDQLYLMPPSMREWLPDDHLAFFVLDAVEQFDLHAFYAAYRDDGWGRPAYDPKMLVALLLYAYCIGERSSRKIERRCTEDVAFRIIAANLTPDHATIARFRASHSDALSGLFTEVLRLCAQAGLVRVGTVAIDGTKLAAYAAVGRNRTADAIGAEVDRILREAAEVDAAEDELYGPDKRGDEMPEVLRDPASRLAYLRELKASLDAEDAAKRGEVEAHEARRKREEASGQRRPGARLKPKDPAKLKPAQVNLTDPDSRPMKTPSGFLQGYNAQLSMSEDQIILAAELTTDANDLRQFEPMLHAAMHNLSAATVTEHIGAVVADAGYYTHANALLDVGPDIYIATGRSKSVRTQPPLDTDPGPPPTAPRRVVDANAERERRNEILTRWEHDEITAQQAADEIGVDWTTAYQMRKDFRRTGQAWLPRTTYDERPRSVQEWMRAKMATRVGQAIYAKRSQSVEPVFGQLKEDRGFRRFMRRGRDACDGELKLMAAAHNILKAWKRIAAPIPAPA